ncbi:PaaI family thioesterase [Peribacillus frigoritolerans]|nr:PaaI family thioesterase [Peribacillus frigoritolerans]
MATGKKNLMKNNNFRQLIGVSTSVKDQRYYPCRLMKKLLQSGNMVHGGVFSVLIDSVIGTAVRTVLEENTFGITAEMKINYFSASNEKELYKQKERWLTREDFSSWNWRYS